MNAVTESNSFNCYRKVAEILSEPLTIQKVDEAAAVLAKADRSMSLRMDPFSCSYDANFEKAQQKIDEARRTVFKRQRSQSESDALAFRKLAVIKTPPSKSALTFSFTPPS